MFHRIQESVYTLIHELKSVHMMVNNNYTSYQEKTVYLDDMFTAREMQKMVELI